MFCCPTLSNAYIPERVSRNQYALPSESTVHKELMRAHQQLICISSDHAVFDSLVGILCHGRTCVVGNQNARLSPRTSPRHALQMSALSRMRCHITCHSTCHGHMSDGLNTCVGCDMRRYDGICVWTVSRNAVSKVELAKQLSWDSKERYDQPLDSCWKPVPMTISETKALPMHCRQVTPCESALRLQKK